MSVLIHFGGKTYTLAPEYDCNDVTNNLLRRSNHVFRKAGRAEFRDDPLIEGDAQDFQPWAFFRLADGGEINIWVHDGMKIAIEDTEGSVAPETKTEIMHEPFQ
ncbi:hypothetical protein [Brevibacterium aurantiacum]|uniref:hypothetical protein n=1 Tax=Brevibacterium aurantiacum TaxID=273384 RepID=UPI003F8DA639